MIYTTPKLFDALQTVIPNLPRHCSEITISMKAGEIAPTVWAVFYPAPEKAVELPRCNPGKRFYLVSEEDWERLEQARKQADLDLRNLESTS